MNRRQLALYLALTPGVGGRSVVRILTRLELRGLEPPALFKLSPEALVEEFAIKRKQAEAILRSSKPLDALHPQLDRLEKLGVAWVTLVDAHYPALIEQFDPDPPGVLFLFGNSKLLDARTFGILSSRDSPPAALDLIETLAEDGVLAGEILSTGHNTREYQRAALVPLRYGAPRILTLDRGLYSALGPNLTEELFPSARLWRFQFDAKTDLVVTPFRPDAEYSRVNNQVRDRIIAGLCRRLDLVEVNPGGNMEKLGRMALKAGRPLRVSDRTPGARRFVEAGAELIEKAHK